MAGPWPWAHQKNKYILYIQIYKSFSVCKRDITLDITNNEKIDKEDKLKFKDIPTRQDFSDVFPKEIPRLPPKRDLDFTIKLVPLAIPNSKDPY